MDVHPMFMDLAKAHNDVTKSATIHGSMIQSAGLENVVVADDSDRACVIELSPEGITRWIPPCCP
jgi:hypothetical protein